MATERRMIDANALRRRIANTPISAATKFVSCTLIDDAPTVDAVEVVHGYNTRWDWPSLFTCSVCGWHDDDTYTGDTETYNYCPNCGAKMD